MPRYHIRIASDRLLFSAGHFITLQQGVCEPLHGHDYRVTAEVYGDLNEEHYVVDFLVVEDILRGIVDELDHRVLLPTQHRAINVATDKAEIVVRFEGRRWVLPASDCRLLPLANTTSELLAGWIGQRLLDGLQARLGQRPTRLRIELREGRGQSATCELDG
jgi:6-pyruvoyltetrahydropterin/6-carboxytetrahydropterin synthase